MYFMHVIHKILGWEQEGTIIFLLVPISKTEKIYTFLLLKSSIVPIKKKETHTLVLYLKYYLQNEPILHNYVEIKVDIGYTIF